MTNKQINLYLTLIRECLLDNIYKQQRFLYSNNTIGNLIDPNSIEEGVVWPDRAHTMIGRKRLNNIRFCIEHCIKNNIEGDVIETGVWRGGATIFMKAILEAYESSKKVYVADSFEGLPPPDENKYPLDKNDPHHTYSNLAISLEKVQENFKSYDLLDSNVVFVKGFFENTIPSLKIDKLCVLRLDGDMYGSTIVVLDSLYDSVSVGGFIIIDDWTLPSCHQAVLDFLNKRNINPTIIPIDKMGVFWCKS